MYRNRYSNIIIPIAHYGEHYNNMSQPTMKSFKEFLDYKCPSKRRIANKFYKILQTNLGCL